MHGWRRHYLIFNRQREVRHTVCGKWPLNIGWSVVTVQCAERFSLIPSIGVVITSIVQYVCALSAYPLWCHCYVITYSSYVAIVVRYRTLWDLLYFVVDWCKRFDSFLCLSSSEYHFTVDDGFSSKFAKNIWKGVSCGIFGFSLISWVQICRKSA